MLLEAVWVLIAAGLLVALPGWLLVVALFPHRSSLSVAERTYLSLGGGILLLMLVASVLGFLPHGQVGHLQSLATGGMPNVELSMLVVSGALLYVGARRGAHAWLVARYPRLLAPFAARAPVKES